MSFGQTVYFLMLIILFLNYKIFKDNINQRKFLALPVKLQKSSKHTENNLMYQNG